MTDTARRRRRFMTFPVTKQLLVLLAARDRAWIMCFAGLISISVRRLPVQQRYPICRLRPDTFGARMTSDGPSPSLCFTISHTPSYDILGPIGWSIHLLSFADAGQA